VPRHNGQSKPAKCPTVKYAKAVEFEYSSPNYLPKRHEAIAFTNDVGGHYS